MSTELIRYSADSSLQRAVDWAELPDEERRRLAVQAAHAHDADALWQLTDAWLTLAGRKGALVSAHTRRNYRQALVPPAAARQNSTTLHRPEPFPLLLAWREENLLHPRRMAGRRWLRQLEGRGFKSSTVHVYLAAARALYSALREAGATEADPFKDLHPVPDSTRRSEKRSPYSEAEIKRLLACAEGHDCLLVLLGAYAGLRVSEMVALRWSDLDLQQGTLVVHSGKGGKRRSVPLARQLRETLMASQPNGSLYVLPYDLMPERPGPGRPRSTDPAAYPQTARLIAWRRLRHLCQQADVRPRGVHAERHTAGTRLYRQTNNIRDVMVFLGHANADTAMVYAEYSDQALRSTVAEWE